SVKPVNLIPLEVDVLLLHIFYPSLLFDSNAKMHSHCLIWHNGYVKCPFGLFPPHHLLFCSGLKPILYKMIFEMCI
ncbi:MAG: hypothetical protein RMK18_12210, partial [Armatimonadota bacterium]|nr:hypothetical protein [Armatimonadota bacterium]